jgi:hypothetical protein
MLTDLDTELFPDDCEVVEIPLHNRHVYLIQKNGSSSLRDEALEQGWCVHKNQDVRAFKSIDVYLRDPAQRYASGVNTFIQHLMRDNDGLDPRTCEFFATRYLFLNRHYLPQWHWLANLARFIDENCLIRLHPLEHLRQITSRRSRAGIQPLLPDQVINLSISNDKLELWFLLDRILIGHCGKSLTWREIMQIYQEHPARPLEIVRSRTEAVQNVLC